MNLSKFKAMSGTEKNINIDHMILENVEESVYLGFIIKIGKESQTAEIRCRIRLLANYVNYWYTDRSHNQTQSLRPVTTNVLETMTKTKKSGDSLRVMQRAMKRAKLKGQNQQRRNLTKTQSHWCNNTDRRTKWQWVEHVARQDQIRWTLKVTH